jgi:ubiquinone/menaquinone biosynthesis C-methylase UbiE
LGDGETSGWIERTPEQVASRYDRLAPVYGLFEWLYALPLLGVRRRSVEALRLAPGDSVLEVGCGSGRNFALVEERIGPRGSLYGVDASHRMLTRAQSLVRRRGWSNVHLTHGDAASFAPPQPVRAVLFCFSYSTMRDRLAILERAWNCAGEGGRVVVTDARLRPGWPRRLFSRLAAWTSGLTLLGRPDTDPAGDLRALAGRVEETRISLGPLGFDYVVCAAERRAAGAGRSENGIQSSPAVV